jgi:dTDP-4-amino-4,6-dideoxygalactose transaminase
MIDICDLGRILAPQRAELESAAVRVLAGGRYILGDEVAAFEREFAAYCGTAQAVGVANGTDALILALTAVGVGPGDRVLCVANAGGYASVAIVACGAQAQLVDIDPTTLRIDADAALAALETGPKALILTHLYGVLAGTDALIAAARRHGVALIEDAAQAHGACRDGRRAGSFGDLGCFSFYPTKNLGALGDGGAVVGSDAGLLERVRRLRQYGWSAKYRMEVPGGINSRLDELQAAFLRLRLPRLDAENAARRRIVERYSTAIRHPAIRLPQRGGDADVGHLFVLRCRERERLAAHLAAAGVRSDIHYPIADHRQPALAGQLVHADLPHTDAACAEVLTLPCHPALTDDEVRHVIEACHAFRA